MKKGTIPKLRGKTRHESVPHGSVPHESVSHATVPHASVPHKTSRNITRHNSVEKKRCAKTTLLHIIVQQ